MKLFKQSESGARGWFVGPFNEAVFKTDLFEVAWGFNPKGDVTKPHYHAVATEINLITHGSVHVNGMIVTAGEGFILEPHEVCNIEYLEDTHTLCIKTPGVLGDKYCI